MACEECNIIVEKAWNLHQEILLIKEELEKVITGAVNEKGRRSAGREQRLYTAPVDDDYEDYLSDGNESVNGIPSPGHVVEMVKEEPTSDFELDEHSMDYYSDYEEDPVSPGEIQGDVEINNGGRQKRRSRIKAEDFLRARREEDKRSESEEERSEFGVSEENIDNYVSSDDEQYSGDSEVEAMSKSKPKRRRNSSHSISCSQCDVTFTRVSDKTRHIKRIHEKKRPFPCTSCDKRFFASAELKNHLFFKHSEGEGPSKPKPRHNSNSSHSISCSQCDVTFADIKDRNRHFRRVHEKRRQFPCTSCDQRFFASSELKAHLFSIHSEGEGPSKPKPRHNSSQRISCSQCEATFTRVSDKNRHIKRIHEKERPFPCTSCDKRFFGSSDLQRHLITHDGQIQNDKWKCQKCGKQLHGKSQWLGHEISVCKIDHGEAFYKEHRVVIYPCEFEGCPKKFTIKKELRRHMACHTGRKDFICSKCGSTFAHSSGLRTHEDGVDCTRDGYKAHNHQQSRLKRNHACTLCPHKCLSVEGLAHHQKTLHDIDPPPDNPS